MNEENNTEVFQCICGKRFEKQTSLISHKSQCKIYQESVKEEKLKRIQEKEARRLPNGMFKCENPECGNEHDGSYASGRFCCNKCSRRFIALKNTNAHNPKIKAHLDKLRAAGKAGVMKALYGTWQCKHCNQIFETRSQLQKHIKVIHFNIHDNANNLECPLWKNF